MITFSIDFFVVAQKPKLSEKEKFERVLAGLPPEPTEEELVAMATSQQAADRKNLAAEGGGSEVKGHGTRVTANTVGNILVQENVSFSG
jgi:hypothetical protein